jgi:hypothetical protein
MTAVTGLLHGLPWVTWRQHRAALAGVAALLGSVAVALVVQGVTTRNGYAQLGLDTCGGPDGLGLAHCPVSLGVFLERYSDWAVIVPRFAAFLPGVIGMFVGAPLVARELETGSFRFAWTQGRSPVRWLVVKLLLLAGALTAFGLAFAAAAGWWTGPWLPLMGRMEPGRFYEMTGVVFAARALFGFALGVLIGTLIRRTVPAIAVTGAVWVAAVWSSVLYLRPLITAPLVLTPTSPLVTRTGWIGAEWLQNPAGSQVDVKSAAYVDLLLQAKHDGVPASGFDRWLTQHHWIRLLDYQPADRFWHLQLVEGAAYLLVALLLAATAVAVVRRRVA